MIDNILDVHMTNKTIATKIPVGILGATGSVGQKFIELLDNHPWFEVTALAASERSAGKSYRDAANWYMSSPLPGKIADLKVQTCTPDLPCRIVFSGLDATVAGDIEIEFARAGYIVVSNSRNHRWDEDVPLLIPEVNSDHLQLIENQSYGDGCIVTNPNCSVAGLAIALKPLLDNFGLEKVQVVTMQALSGAGYPGVSSLDIIDNIIPFIGGEEAKIENEPLKILGGIKNGKIQPLQLDISAQSNRVPVIDGHLECVSISLASKVSAHEIIQAWHEFTSIPQELKLPSAPIQPIYYLVEDNYPQPRLHRFIEKGMAICTGRLRPCKIFDYKFVLLSHNTIRGAAGCAILNAELMIEKGIIH